MKVVVNFIKGYTPYAKGDVTRMPEEEAKKLEEAGILKIGGIVANKTMQEPLKDENLKGEEYEKEKVDVVIPTKDKKKQKKSKKTAK